MGQYVMLDAAFPPGDPAQWVTDMASVGAQVGAIYTYGGFTHYTVAHVQQARASQRFVLPIVVPGNNPPDPRVVLATVAQYGIADGPVAIDRESGSMFPIGWDDAFDALARSMGYRPIEYANLNDARTPRDIDEEWQARWIRTGIMNPVPALPPGIVAWQFVDDVAINGTQYDVSVVGDWLWDKPRPIGRDGGGMSNNIILPDDDIAPALWRIVLEEGTGHVWWGVHAGGEGGENVNAWVNNLSTFGNPPDGAIAFEPDTVGAALHHFQGEKRIVVSGRERAGARTWQITLKAQDDYGFIEPWHVIPLNVTIAKAQQGPKGDSGSDDALRTALRGALGSL